MANEQFAFLSKEKVPSREIWQKAIDKSGFDFKLHPELDPIRVVGFVPCTLADKDAGCEMYFHDSLEFLSAFGELAGGRDCCISFRWGGNMRECASAMIASYVLANEFDAIVSYEGDEPYVDMSVFLRDTKAIVQEALKER